jgi:glycine hydroxymethyltransferase
MSTAMSAATTAVTLANRIEVHDPDGARRGARGARCLRRAARHGRCRGRRRGAQRGWRGEQCINLLAPEAPTSPGVRALLAAEIGTPAAEGHIGAVNRWFAGTRHIDEVEALCVELLKRCSAAAMPITACAQR